MTEEAVELTQEQIEQVVDVFYNRVRQHPQLTEPFKVVQDWDKHKRIISHFWWIALGGERYMDYVYQVAAKHRKAGFTPELLEQHWLPLFELTMREILPEAAANVWMAQARRIGGSLALNHRYWQAYQKSLNQTTDEALDSLNLPTSSEPPSNDPPPK